MKTATIVLIFGAAILAVWVFFLTGDIFAPAIMGVIMSFLAYTMEEKTE